MLIARRNLYIRTAQQPNGVKIPLWSNEPLQLPDSVDDMPRTLLSYVVAWSIWGRNAQTSSVGSFILVFCPFLIVKICAAKPYYTPSRSFTSMDRHA